MDEISISSVVGELHQPLNNALNDPRQNNSCSLSPNLCERKTERIQNGKEERRGGRRHRAKDDKIKVICEICQALIWNSASVSRIIDSMNCVAITSRWNPFSLTNQKENRECLKPYRTFSGQNSHKVRRWFKKTKQFIPTILKSFKVIISRTNCMNIC